MSENEEQVPLTRRERRLREQGETGALDLSELSAADAEADVAPAASPDSSALEDDIEISPFNADGTPRSRREIRMLREQALAARAAAQAAAADTQADATAAEEPAAEEAAAEEPAAKESAEVADVEAAAAEQSAEEEVVEEETAAGAADSGAPVVASESEELVEDFDSLISPPTEPFTVEELRAAETAPAGQHNEADATLLEAEAEAEAETESADTESADAAASAPAPAGKPRLKFWKRDKTAEAVASEEAVTEAAEPDVTEPEVTEPAVTELEVTELEVTETAAEEPEAIAPEVTEPEVTAPDVTEPEAVEITPEDVTVDAAAADESAQSETKETYSFPDIAPPEEWRSVFDDPATRNVPLPAEEPQGDFDDLISRAVAQEGSTNGTSALILPSMPEDTGGLTGPLGATGELYVTGSMRLPKSLGETGGHVPLHDSAEMDPITGAETVDEHGTVAGPAPVSARHAVSARVVSGVPAVAKPTKERTRLPLVLGLTGGGLLVVVVGLGIWGASNGLFG